MKMKKMVFFAALAVCTGVMLTGCGSKKSLSLKQQQAKKLETMYAQKMAEYKTEGWKLAGSSRTLEVALLDHYVKLYDEPQENNQELVGEVSQCKSINVCRQMATNNAIVQYANLANSFVKGRVESDLNADANVPQAEFDKMYAAYERLVSANIKGVLTESYAIVKEENLVKQYKLFFLVNEEKAATARTKAMENALKETAIAQEYATKIADFVNEGFKIPE
jgi:uncharacterized protein YceK